MVSFNAFGRTSLVCLIISMAICLNFIGAFGSKKRRMPLAPARPPPAWAFATLFTKSSVHDNNDSMSYLHQALVLGMQLQEAYPDTPRVVVLVEGQVSLSDAHELENIGGYRLLWRPLLRPPYPLVWPLAPVYNDQFMKFWLWNMTDEYSHFVYLDSDTYFIPTLKVVDFDALVRLAVVDVVACPTTWSSLDADNRPISWNGGFFIARTSTAMFGRLAHGTAHPSHFATHSPRLAWLDSTEMGVFMRELPRYIIPPNANEMCVDFASCCVDASKCIMPYVMAKYPPANVKMVHFLKPYATSSHNNDKNNRVEAIKGLFSHQARTVYEPQGYNSTCILEDYVAPLAEYIVSKCSILKKILSLC